MFKKLNKKILAILLLTIPSGISWAYCGPPPAPFTVTMKLPSISNFAKSAHAGSEDKYDTDSYWKECWSSVEIDTFGGPAMDLFMRVKTDYQQRYHAALLATVTEASEQKIAAMQSGYQALLQTMTENYMALNKAKVQIETDMMEQELDYKKELQEQLINEQKHGMFSDGNGEGGIVKTDTQSYKFFKEICKRNKMFAKTSGETYNNKRNSNVNKKITAKSKQMSEVTGSTNEIANEAIENHASEFCSAFDIKYNQCVNPDLKLCVEDDIDSGVCTISENEIFTNENLDSSAINFLKPDGYAGRYSYDGNQLEAPKNKIEDELFEVTSTYTEEQKRGAESFASSLIFQPSVKAPTIAERDVTKAENANYVSEYNRYLANLNLANYSFTNSIQAREKLELEGEIPMSERDVMRYLIHSFGNPDALVASKSGKELSSETMIYQLMTIKNKLELEEFQQKERIETLLAALLAAQANNPDLINKLNSLK